MKSGAKSWISVYAPATVANVGPGFDCFGFSLGSPGDNVKARIVGKPGVRIVSIKGDGGMLPKATEQNTAGVAAQTLWQRHPDIAERFGLEMIIEKGLPIGSGLGSSAASAVAGAAAAMYAISSRWDIPYDKDEVMECSVAGESIASGSRHGDNVAPAVYGGFTIVRSISPLSVAHFKPKKNYHIATVLPKLMVPTRQARQMLPHLIPLSDAITNWANASSLILALLTGDDELLAKSMSDRIVEPIRARLIPGYADVRKAALDRGALGCVIGGAGPAMIAFATTDAQAKSVAQAMARAFRENKVESVSFTSTIDHEGARLA